MFDVQVKDKGSSFEVTVCEGQSRSQHKVTVSEEYYQQLTQGNVSKEECIKASFRFLLDREPKESILGRFELPVISHYFPEFEKKFKDYLSI